MRKPAAENPTCQICKNIMRKNGKDKNDRQKYYCKYCKSTSLAGNTNLPGIRANIHDLCIVLNALLSGYNYSDISKMTGRKQETITSWIYNSEEYEIDIIKYLTDFYSNHSDGVSPGILFPNLYIIITRRYKSYNDDILDCLYAGINISYIKIYYIINYAIQHPRATRQKNWVRHALNDYEVQEHYEEYTELEWDSELYGSLIGACVATIRPM